jgi:hypothetical protein
MPYLIYWTVDKLDWIGYKLKNLARKQYLQLYLFQIGKWCYKVHFSKYRNIYTSFSKESLLNVHKIHQETLGQYYIAFSCTYLDNWLKTIQEWAGILQENKNLLRKRQTSRSRLKPGSERPEVSRQCDAIFRFSLTDNFDS